MGVLAALVLIFFCCLIIWRACDGFETASEYLGRNLSEGVRGGTINAISSSLPELFTTLLALFFVAQAEGQAANEEAFAIGIGTTAGSAIFNGMIIPAVCILAVVGGTFKGIRVGAVQVAQKVILRDGLALILCELMLILMLNGDQLYWWHGMLLILMYLSYFLYMVLSMKPVVTDYEPPLETSESRGLAGHLFYWLSLGPLLDLEHIFVREKHRQAMAQQTWNAWPLLLGSTGVIGIACWLLVVGCEWLGSGPDHPAHFLGQTLPPGLDIPIIFVAVIFASMATSVPDTIISIRDARDGDYDDAVANALGSNIFDICFALGFPLLLYTLIYQKPIEMGPEVAHQSAELRLWLLTFTVIGFVVFLTGKRTQHEGTQCIAMNRLHALALLLIYATFAVYIASQGLQVEWALQVSEWVQSSILPLLPDIPPGPAS